MRVLFGLAIMGVLVLGACQAQTIGESPTLKTTMEPTQTKAFYALSIQDMESIEKWYKHVFDMSVAIKAERPPPDGPVVILENDAFMIEMMQRTDSTDPLNYSGGYKEAYKINGIYKIGFSTEDIDSLAAKLKTKGAEFNHDIVSTGEPLSLRTFAVRDPEGNTIQVFGK